MNLGNVTRVVVYDHGHRKEQLGVKAELSLEDRGRTLKVWIDPHPDKTAQDVRLDIHTEMSADLERISRLRFFREPGAVYCDATKEESQ